MKENTLKAVISAALAGAAAYFRELVGPVLVLALVMLIDYISGMVSAWVRGDLSSRVGVIGIVKKVAYLLAVAIAIIADWAVQTAATELGVNLSGFFFFGLLVTIWLVLNECISILENIAEIGVPVPAFLLKVIDKLKKTVEDTGDKAGDGTETEKRE